MLASFSDSHLQQLAGRGAGIVGCELMPRAGSYDHKRSPLRIDEGRGFSKDVVCPMWGFIIFSSTGDATGILPKWDSVEFGIHYYVLGGCKLIGHDDTGIMIAPHGLSAGPATLQHYKRKETDETWHQIPANEIFHRA